MLTIHKISGLKVTAPLPVLNYNEDEAKIANIPGWSWFISANQAWLDNSTRAVTERVDGAVFSPNVASATSDINFLMGTFADGSPSFDLGYNGTSSSGYKVNNDAGGEISFLLVGMVKSQESGTGHILYSQKKSDSMVNGDFCIRFLLSTSGVPNAAGGNKDYNYTILMGGASSHNYSSLGGKLCSLLFTWSSDNGTHIYVNGENQTLTSPSLVNLTQNRVASEAHIGLPEATYTRQNPDHKIACMGVLNIDLSKPVNKAYRNLINTYVENTYPLSSL